MSDPYCCMPDKLKASIEGFDAGLLCAYKSVRYLVSRLDTDGALQVLDELIAEAEQ